LSGAGAVSALLSTLEANYLLFLGCILLVFYLRLYLFVVYIFLAAAEGINNYDSDIEWFIHGLFESDGFFFFFFFDFYLEGQPPVYDFLLSLRVGLAVL
jgi:hypothetical protein